MFENHSLIRLGVFFGLFVLLSLLELWLPKRATRGTKASNRKITNLLILALDVISLRLLAIVLPLLAIGAAVDAADKSWGLFNWLDWPWWLEALLAVAILDFIIWAQHLISHKIPILWRLHQVHHADQEMDVTTGIRFHPIEIALSMLLKIGMIYLLGPLVIAVVFYEILLNGMALFNHANLRIPKAIESWLRWIIVTPDMHRIHHSVHRREHDSNYGNTLSIWDRLFKTYIAKANVSDEKMELGLWWREEGPEKLGWNLLLPFKKP
jgi:sterol desaturase/sphingolipid hydroxylase (fatty acid hydroxylase superfamily)